MKKIIFIVITLWVINVSSASAQAVWGGRIGLSYYTETVKTSGISFSGNASGAELGPVLYYSLKNNLYINSGVMLGIMTASGDSEDRDDYQIQYNDNKYYYIDVPLYFGVNIPVSNSSFSFFGQAGPYVGYWFSSNSYVKEIINPLQAGLGIMAGINIKRFKFEFGYKVGLTNLTSVEEGYTFESIPFLESTSKLSSLFLGISYVF